VGDGGNRGALRRYSPPVIAQYVHMGQGEFLVPPYTCGSVSLSAETVLEQNSSSFSRALFDGLLPGDIKVAVVEKKERPAGPHTRPLVGSACDAFCHYTTTSGIPQKMLLGSARPTSENVFCSRALRGHYEQSYKLLGTRVCVCQSVRRFCF
jgi:hypothetical protein